MSSKSYQLPEIGELLVKKHYKAKRIILKLRPNQLPQVTIPKLMPFKFGYEFAKEKQQWIINQQKRLLEIEEKKIIYDENSLFKTRFSEIRFQHYKGGKILTHFKNNCFYLLFPEKENLHNTSNQENIKHFIIEVLRNEAKNYLPKRTKLLSEKFNFSYKTVFVKNLKSRWGSCSAQNNINLNLHLMRMPEYLSDFIILHELCHTVHKNHGEAFHHLLNQLVGDEKKLNKELKNYCTYL